MNKILVSFHCSMISCAAVIDRIAVVTYFIPLKTSETRGFFMLSGSIERDKWHEIELVL